MENNSKYLSVSLFNSQIKNFLEQNFTQNIYIKGEISNFRISTTGHGYFTLKDINSSIKCIIWKNNLKQLKFKLLEGETILLDSNLNYYSKTGDITLLVKNITKTGLGELFLQKAKLKEKYKNLGYFDQKNKKVINKAPNIIGVITGYRSAALHDIIDTLQRRWPNLNELLIFSTKVQGLNAADDIAKKIFESNNYNFNNTKIDTLILARGGGSEEDLWCFNDPKVVEAIYQSKIPIITGIGHAIDNTLSDYVSDLYAETPTAAAEKATFNQPKMLETIIYFKQNLIKNLLNKIKYLEQQKDNNTKILINTTNSFLNYYDQFLKNIENNLYMIIKNNIDYFKKHLLQTKQSLKSSIEIKILFLNNIKFKVKNIRNNYFKYLKYLFEKNLNIIHNQKQNNITNINNLLYSWEQKIKFKQNLLKSFDPNLPLQRFYSLTTINGNIIKNIDNLNVNDKINTKLWNGEITSKITYIKKEKE